MNDEPRDDDPFALLTAPGHLLRRNHQRSYDIFARLVGSDVTRQQIALLFALSHKAGVSQNDLVAQTGFDKSTAKEMIGRMIAKGWVERTRAPDDGRAWAMSITPAGQQLLDQRMPAVRAAQIEIMAPLPRELRPVFLHCLQTLIGVAGEGPEDA